ncbi:MAG: DNA methyltransferase [Candidatus Cloacimonadota bacterium]|nr:DNA methyltransferase [Candidatus Cloacimonadota bacterium]
MSKNISPVSPPAGGSNGIRPREKLLASDSPKMVGTEDLLAIILGHGSKGKNVFDLSKEVIKFLRENMGKEIKVSELTQFNGIGEAKALQIVSALEIGKRFYKDKTKMQIKKVRNGELIIGDCLDVMQTMPDNEIILAFTSPPYLNAINYEDQIKKLSGEIKYWERKEVSYEYYKNFLIDRFKELYRIVKPGGHNVVNISPIAWNGKRIALPFHFVSWMENIGWIFKEDIIWEKEIARDRRSGVLMQHPYPGYYYPSLVVEYVFVFQKPAEKKEQNNIYYFRTRKEKEENKIDLSDYQDKKSKNIWRIRPVAPQENIHPCPFPLELAKRVIKYYSYKWDTVIDIFTGSGQTNLAAELLGRKHIGIDTQEKYIKYAERRINNQAKQLHLEDI